MTAGAGREPGGPARALRQASRLEIAVLAAIAANLLCMEVWPGWEWLPLHLAFVTLTLAYWAGAWCPPWRLVAIVVVACVVTAVTWAAEGGRRGVAEEIETVLLTLSVAAAIWRTRTRRRARSAGVDMPHELLNAMTVIRGHVELLGRGGPASSDDVALVKEVVIDELDHMTERIDGRVDA